MYLFPSSRGRYSKNKGQITAAVDYFLRLKSPPYGTQKRVAHEFGIRPQTFNGALQREIAARAKAKR